VVGIEKSSAESDLPVKRLLVLGGSISRHSINRQFAIYAASQVPNTEATVLDLNDFAMPIFSVDLEETEGIPDSARRFLELIRSHDAIVVSLAEHNGSYAVGFKNIYDWVSRLEVKLWSGKPMLLLSTSPGARGGATVHQAASRTFPRMGATLCGSFSLPSFHDHFSAEAGITDENLRSQFESAVKQFSDSLDCADPLG